VTENATEHSLDVLQSSFAQVVFFRDGLEHSARVHRSALTQNKSDIFSFQSLGRRSAVALPGVFGAGVNYE
jgi:hypothetical protein